MPDSDSRYYLFTTDRCERFLTNGFRYPLLVMYLDDFFGAVLTDQKNLKLLDAVIEKICAIAHPNDTDICVLTHKYFSDAFYAYRVTPEGIEPTVITRIRSDHTANQVFEKGCGAAIGQMKATSEGK